jgi:putative endonuclease
LTRTIIYAFTAWIGLQGACFRLTRDRSAGAPAPTGGRKRILPLAEVGYAIVARKFCSPGCRGEIDPIGWNEDVLCFVDVKARTTHNEKIPEAAVDRHNRREVAQVARSYRRRLPP